MGREVRRVPPDWRHPIDWEKSAKRRQLGMSSDYSFLPLYEGKRPVEALQVEWDLDRALWLAGQHADQVRSPNLIRDAITFEDWSGDRPKSDDYMPFWTADQATHYQMYETCSEGTPLSPVLATPEAVAHWCAENGASMFGASTANYEAWLSVAMRGEG